MIARKVGRTVVALGVAVICTLGVERAHAHVDDEAREHFRQGVLHADLGAWGLAVEHFRAAYALRRTPTVVYNLASALEQTNELATAAALFRIVARDPAAEPNVRRAAVVRHRRLAVRLARRVVAPAPAPDPPPSPPALASGKIVVSRTSP